MDAFVLEFRLTLLHRTFRSVTIARLLSRYFEDDIIVVYADKYFATNAAITLSIPFHTVLPPKAASFEFVTFVFGTFTRKIRQMYRI